MMKASPVAGFIERNRRNPACDPVCPTRVVPSIASTVNESPNWPTPPPVRGMGRHISSRVLCRSTVSYRRASAVSPRVAPVRNDTQVTTSATGAFHPPFGNGDARVEVPAIHHDRFASRAVPVDRIAVRAIGSQEVRRRPEIAAGHAERGPDVLLDVGLVRVAGDRLDDAREVDEGGIAVAVLRARRKVDLLVRHHRHELLPAGRLERLPRTRHCRRARCHPGSRMCATAACGW